MTCVSKIMIGAAVAAALSSSAAQACYYPDNATFRAEEEAHERLLRESHRVEATFSLPGGYPELHAGALAAAANFKTQLAVFAQTRAVHGECGGYMVLGESLTDAGGTRHRMAGLLGLATSFAERRLHLGYRHLESRAAALAGRYRGHEFHYATTLAAEGAPLFGATDAEGTELPPMGLVEGRVMGSFAHVIAPQLVLGPGPA